MKTTVQFFWGDTINGGDTAWMIVATALVMLMAIPGLSMFYGGLTKSRHVLNAIMMSFVTYCLVSLIWVLWGYSLTFGPSWGGLIGGLEKAGMNGITSSSITGTIPEFIFVAFQMTFAAITVALVSGSFVERMKFSAWILFVMLWCTLVYVPIAHWVWGGGFLAKLGALDFAGGTVVHISAGMAGLAGALLLGRRHDPAHTPNNLTFTIVGTGLLWFGWFGFNGGSALSSGPLAASAFLVTNTAAAAAALVWLLAEQIHRGKTTSIGAASGAVAGLVGITPAAGYVDVFGALAIGALCAIASYFMTVTVKAKLGYDDTLDVFGIHGVSGIVGAVLTGVFANPAINPAAAGLLYGNPSQIGIQLVAVGVVMVFSFVATLAIKKAIDFAVGIRVSPEHELAGLDTVHHGERAYHF